MSLNSLNVYNSPTTVVYSINAQDSAPQFECIGRYIAPSPARLFGLYGTKILFLTLHDYESTYFAGYYDFTTQVTVRWQMESIEIEDVSTRIKCFVQKFTIVPNHQFDFLDDDSNILMAITDDFKQAIFYKTPPVPSSCKPGDVIDIDPPHLYDVSWADELETLGASYSIQSSSCLVPHRISDSGPLNWEFLVKTYDSRVVVLSKSLLFESPTSEGGGSQQQEKSWMPVTIHQQQFGHSEFPLDYEDVPYSVTFPDRWRIMWWEDARTESLIQFHYSRVEEVEASSSLSEFVPSDSFRGVLDTRPEDSQEEFEGPFAYSRYTFVPFLGRACFVEDDGFRVVDY